MEENYDLIAFGAHPDDVEAFMGGTLAKLTRRGMRALIVDLTSGEPARHARPGARRKQALEAARLLGASRLTLDFQDRMIVDHVEGRLKIASLIRTYRPRWVFTSEGRGVHPDHGAATDLVLGGVFYARLPKWSEVPGGEILATQPPHEIERLFFGHCRMEPAWERFDFAVDVSEVYPLKQQALAVYASVFGAGEAGLLERFDAEDQMVGRMVGVVAAEPFRARSPLLVDDPSVFAAVRYG